MDPNTVLDPHLRSQRLPPELWCYVIDIIAIAGRDSETGIFLCAEVRALYICGRVCRFWRNRAKRWLQQEIVLNDARQLLELTRKLSRTANALAPRIQNLRICFPRDGWYSVSNVLSLLPMLFNNFGVTSLETLHLSRNVKLTEPHRAEITHLPYLPLHPCLYSLLRPTLSTVIALSISDIDFHSFADFGRFLHCFTHLRILSCHRVGWKTLSILPGCMGGNTSSKFLPEVRQIEVRTHRAQIHDCYAYTCHEWVQ